MPRPETHRQQAHERCCGNCKHCHLVAYKLDLMCFHGDSIEVEGESKYPVSANYVFLDGQEVGLLDGDEYDKVWCGRIIDHDDVCDQWEEIEESNESAN